MRGQVESCSMAHLRSVSRGAGREKHGQAQVQRLCEKEDSRRQTCQPGQWAHTSAGELQTPRGWTPGRARTPRRGPREQS